MLQVQFGPLICLRDTLVCHTHAPDLTRRHGMWLASITTRLDVCCLCEFLCDSTLG